jgi:glycosyltransferase involved in cell wall biosynthesis
MPIKNIFFSIVIPTYNRADFIVKAIESIVNQTYQNFEIIIVDDGSTDNTEDIVKNVVNNKLKYFKIPNSERGFARNCGTKKSVGDYVTFLDSDDVLLPNYFSNAIETINKYNSPPFFHLGYEIVNTDHSNHLKVTNLINDDIDFLVKGNSLSCMGCFLRADKSREFLFNEDRNLSGSEDWELWLRVLANCGIKTDNRISARMYNHSSRSVHTTQETKLSQRKILALAYAFTDEKVSDYYSKFYKKMDAFADSYISLHLALVGDIKNSFKYLVKFIKNHPKGIFTIRFLAIIKCMLFNLNTKI